VEDKFHSQKKRCHGSDQPIGSLLRAIFPARELTQNQAHTMTHSKQKQSTGSWKGKRDKHQGQQKQLKEKKRQNGSYKGR